MKKPLFAFIFAAALAPFAASPVLAQTTPAGPPAQVRTQIEQLRATAKTNAFNALSQDHRNRVNAIISQVNAGTLDRRDAASQIDAILTPAESQAVLAVGQTMREQMRSIFAQYRRPGASDQNHPGGFGQRPDGANGPNGQARRAPDAGRILVMLGANRREPRGF